MGRRRAKRARQQDIGMLRAAELLPLTPSRAASFWLRIERSGRAPPSHRLQNRDAAGALVMGTPAYHPITRKTGARWGPRLRQDSKRA